MADVTGPISTLPGSSHHIPKGTMCDNHDDRPAVARMQGETDSFGSEMHDLCKECLEEWRDAEPMTGRCDWCRTDTKLTTTRDYEEGMAGRVYYVCTPCYRNQQDAIRQELDDEDSNWGDDYD